MWSNGKEWYRLSEEATVSQADLHKQMTEMHTQMKQDLQAALNEHPAVAPAPVADCIQGVTDYIPGGKPVKTDKAMKPVSKPKKATAPTPKPVTAPKVPGVSTPKAPKGPPPKSKSVPKSKAVGTKPANDVSTTNLEQVQS